MTERVRLPEGADLYQRTLITMGAGGWAAIKLADALGVSRERMSDVLQTLRRRGLVEHKGAWSRTHEKARAEVSR